MCSPTGLGAVTAGWHSGHTCRAMNESRCFEGKVVAGSTLNPVSRYLKSRNEVIMPKPRLRPEICVLLVAGFVLVCLNTHFWRLLYQAVAPQGSFEWLFLASVLVVMLALFNLLFGAFAVLYVFLPVITLF